MPGDGEDQVVQGDQDRDQWREKWLRQGRTREQIATAMMRKFKVRRRVAWRNAHGWTQDHVADLFNEKLNDPRKPMTGSRISDFERWPISSRTKPTFETLGVLADIYGTTVLNLIDDHDYQNMTLKERANLAALKKQLLAAGNTRLSGLTFAYADSVVPEQLPNVSPYFVGRTQELDKLTAQLDNTAEGGPVVITAIGGTPGIGKTTLAVQWAQTHSDEFPDGQLYVNLRGFHPTGTPMTPQEAIRGFLDAFGTPVEKIPTSLDSQAALYRNLVKDKNLVIVLDNARDTDQVRPLLPDSPTCMVLVTSRQQLNSLAYDGATHITLGFLTTEEAHQLLIKILGPERIHAEPEAVNELIHRCVHLPTALHIAAARIKTEPHTSLDVLVGQLREQRQRLTALSTGDSQYFDIRAVFSWSYTALSTGAARLFRLLGVHPGPGINTLAAASLTGLPEHDTRNLLAELNRAHLLEEPTPGRYQFHDLLSAYAAEQATIEEPEPQQQAARHRVLDYYLHTGFAAERCLDPHRTTIALEVSQPGTVLCQITDYEQAMNWFTAEHAVLLSATSYAAAHGFDSHAWQLSWALVTFLYRRGHWHDWAATQQTALAAAERLGDHIAQALAYRELGNAYSSLRHYTDSLANLHEALTVYEKLGDHDGQASTYRALAWAYQQQQKYDQALTYAQHALTHSRTTGHRFGQAHALNLVGWYYALLGQYQQTLTYCQQALNLFRELNDRDGEAATLDSLGYAHHHLGHQDQAISHYQHALRLCQELGDYYYEALALMKLGDTHHVIGNIVAARDTWRQALTIFDQLGHPDADTVRAKLAGLDTDPEKPTTEGQLKD
jgi:tetratricopeptide (TPR) repeat protein/transcriptional regulator with XRE-family HTH domain